MEIIRNDKIKSMKLGVKRLYLPFKIEYICPVCKIKGTNDLSQDYISYPDLIAPFEDTFYCEECSHEWDVKLRLEVNLKVEGRNE